VNFVLLSVFELIAVTVHFTVFQLMCASELLENHNIAIKNATVAKVEKAKISRSLALR